MENLAVAWVPKSSAIPKSQSEVLNLGGRIVDTDLSLADATKVKSCLIVGAPSHGDYDGTYVIIE